MEQIRPLVGDLPANFGRQVLIDRRGHFVVCGALASDTTKLIDGHAARAGLANLSTEDRWLHISSRVPKQGANPPSIQHPTMQTATLTDRRLSKPVTLTQVGFVTRMGMDPAEYRGLEPKPSTTLDARGDPAGRYRRPRW